LELGAEGRSLGVLSLELASSGKDPLADSHELHARSGLPVALLGDALLGDALLGDLARRPIYERSHALEVRAGIAHSREQLRQIAGGRGHRL
jgi:hypothetical protein